MQGERDVDGGSSMLSPRLFGSEEFAVATVSVLTLFGLGAPLLLSCYQHLVGGHLAVGCSFGAFGVVVTGVSGWKLTSSVRDARARLAGRGTTGALER